MVSEENDNYGSGLYFKGLPTRTQSASNLQYPRCAILLTKTSDTLSRTILELIYITSNNSNIYADLHYILTCYYDGENEKSSGWRRVIHGSEDGAIQANAIESLSAASTTSDAAKNAGNLRLHGAGSVAIIL